MKLMLKLSDLTLDTIINLLRSIVSEGFKINDYELYGGNVSKHHMINLESSLYRVAEGHKRRPMILLLYNGSNGMAFYEGDLFIFKNSNVDITTTDDKDKQVVKKFESFNFDIRKTRELQERAELNKALSDAYWKSVESDMEDEREHVFEDMFDDSIYDYYE